MLMQVSASLAPQAGVCAPGCLYHCGAGREQRYLPSTEPLRLNGKVAWFSLVTALREMICLGLTIRTNSPEGR